MITIKDLNKVYKSNNTTLEALKNINLEISKGEIFGVIGLSGAGKSTLIRTLNRLEEPTSGSIIIDGIDITELNKSQLRNLRKEVGMIFQHFNLLSSRTVFDNIAFPLEILGLNKKAIKERVVELLSLVGLSDKSSSYPSQLSGGQKQRVAIARALASNPKVLLCDEATSALDPQTTKSILNLLKEIQDKFKLTIVLITHQMEVIREICNRVAIIENGKIIELDTVEEVFSRPKTATAKAFISHIEPSSKSELVFPEIPGSKVVKLSYLGESAKEPILSNLIRNFEVDINIIDGDINELMSTCIGNLTIQITGDDNKVHEALSWLESHDISLEVIWNG
ncbi:D-methionine ABC transporter ATP-binding protein MetN [Gottschalkia acidurici 9a]|uniref:D-methionine ABC transporter ATP-binding protein MetN n=1 Tax=Gottschalkia acidurici (strain ATCC 7906 / DSM 604 / BCRC 14475 / CIP 104303 / KCTC 5404 / NCIMB 10678 / 9a) TaxID=1128398 RepID=K0AYC6_GOTA9|nr:ATP-binding cassette domain-containing protein [Gottschalkia acidurici]AFS77772.1 D-methionine ABC transporter ATP-binding protein MetN [Gottschalkia acidurici 9a]